MRSSFPRIGLAILTALAAAAGVARAQVFTSSAPISIPLSGPASVYPSVINVANLPQGIASISVRLTGLSHTFTNDIDIMLVSPTGSRFTLLSDVGSAGAIVNADLVFADGFPFASAIVSGTYSCSNVGGSTDVFPPPAPNTPSPLTTFQSLLGTNPNGAWSLYINDDAAGDSGLLQSWSLEFNAAAEIPVPVIDTTMTYQGRLDAAGTPFSGSADFRYSFWSDPVSTAPNSALSPQRELADVAVSNGVFSLELLTSDLGFAATTLYLELAVRSPAGTGDFVTLSPRQRIAPAPQSTFALNADTARALSASDGSPARALTTDADGRIGIGTAMPRSAVHVTAGNDAALGTTNPNGFLTLGPTAGTNLALDNNEILARNNGSASALYLNANGGAPVVIGTNAPLSGVNAQIAGGLLIESGPQDDFVGISFGPFSNQIGGGAENTDPVGIFLSNGNAFKPGGGNWAVLSDPRAKHDILPLTNTLDRLMSLRGYSYEYNDDKVRQGVALPGRQIGLMADEVERVFPDWISRDPQGTRFVTERATTALMIEALRDLRTEKDRELAAKQAEIDNLKARLDRIEAALIAK